MSYTPFDEVTGDTSGQTSVSYTYNVDGIRTSKIVDGIEHRYLLDGTQIVSETWTVGTTEHLIVYIYDESGAPIGLRYRTNAYAADTYDSYFFDKNLQGDIVAIYNASGTKIGSYTYDAWGKCTVTTSTSTILEINIVAQYNPFRYRGYYYDIETQWYYLQSRYYNPDWCRFLNADGYISTGQELFGYNMYAYCNNNSVNKIDYTGNKPGDLFDTIDEAALDFARCYNELSIADKQEYGSAIYRVTKLSITYHKAPWYLLILGIKYTPKVTVTIKYSYTKPFIGKEGNTVIPNFLTTKPIVSTVHTHANYDPKYDNENFSKQDIGWSRVFRMDSYVVTPGGYLKKYTYSNGKISIIPGDIPWDPNSPDHKDIRYVLNIN